KTKGDLWLQTPLQKIGGKGLFVKELEEALLANEADLAVHSLKDLPAHFPETLGLAAICERENPFDAWICPQGHTLATLPPGSVVGTSSLRRTVQLRYFRPDLKYLPLRGNVDTRLRKCFDGEWDAIVLAAAGLKRLDLFTHVTEVFSAEQVLPAVGQGALAIETRLHDERTRALLAKLDDTNTRACVNAERAMNAALGGNCQVPVAGFAVVNNGQLHLTGRVGHPNQHALLQATASGDIEQALMIGHQVADELIKQGAKKLIDDILNHDS
ncbi:MAG TPA: hydroxymethylbilane synthase, partial [Candidatus Berkiella sp.]|nr:hydroxymethylbilane synthase [Candidatus Berkiella sp.]